jgi:hypothetical protein
LERGIIAPRVYHKSFELYIFGLADEAMRLDEQFESSRRQRLTETPAYWR